MQSQPIRSKHYTTSMASLVKTCKTFRLSNKLPWKDVKMKVEGVQFIDDNRAVMVFQKAASKTTLLGCNNFNVVKTCSVFGGDSVPVEDEAEKLRMVLKASGMKTTYVITTTHDFNVFRVDTDVVIDVFRFYQSLSRLGVSVILEHELNEALIIEDDKVVWSISDTVPQKVLASVSGLGSSEARRIVNKSRKKIGLC